MIFEYCLPARGRWWEKLRCWYLKDHRRIPQFNREIEHMYDFCPNCGKVWL